MEAKGVAMLSVLCFNFKDCGSSDWWFYGDEGFPVCVAFYCLNNNNNQWKGASDRVIGLSLKCVIVWSTGRCCHLCPPDNIVPPCIFHIRSCLSCWGQEMWQGSQGSFAWRLTPKTPHQPQSATGMAEVGTSGTVLRCLPWVRSLGQYLVLPCRGPGYPYHGRQFWWKKSLQIPSPFPTSWSCHGGGATTSSSKSDSSLKDPVPPTACCSWLQPSQFPGHSSPQGL